MDMFSLFSIQDRKIKEELKSVETDKMSIAQRIQRIEDEKLYEPTYRDIYHYCDVALDLDKRRVWEMKKVVYKFCEPRKIYNQYSTGYCVKSFFSDFSYSKLLLMIELTDEEITSLNILPDMTWRQIHKVVKDFKKGLLSFDLEEDLNKSDSSSEEVEEVEDKNNNFYNLDKSEFIFSVDGVKINGKKPINDIHKGLKMLEEMIIHDAEYEYCVVKVKKGLGR